MANNNDSDNLPTDDEATRYDPVPYPPAIEPNGFRAAHDDHRGILVRYFGNYEIIAEIARGGMGVVYKARQVNLNRPVALKMILTGHLATPLEVQRFRTEAEAAAKLDHPGIVPIFEIGEEAGQHFFSMGFIEGHSLAERIKVGPLSPRDAAQLTQKVANAIAYAHDHGVIHRDLKPANILLDRHGEPKVTDFGIARKLDDDSGLTRTGTVLGTPSYMAPEQAAGKADAAGPLSDVYSLGALLYCLLSGRPPFQAATPLDTMLQVMEKEPVSVSSLNALIPTDLETICHKCLQKEPAKRYPSAAAMAADLGRWLRGEPIHARAISRIERSWRWVKRHPSVASLVVLTVFSMLAGTIASLTFGWQAEVERNNAVLAKGIALRESERAQAESEEAVKARSVSEKARLDSETQLARSNFFLAVSRWNAGNHIEARELHAEIPVHLRNIEWHWFHRLLEGSSITLYGHSDLVNHVSFSPDGTKVVSGGNDKSIRLWDLREGEEILMLSGHEDHINSVNFSPDGLQIVSASDDKTIKLWDTLAGKELMTYRGHLAAVTAVRFSRDGKQLISGSSDKTVKLWDAASGENLFTFNARSYVSDVSFSPDGTLLAAACRDKFLKVWERETQKEIHTLQGHTDTVTSVSFSPDGTRIVSGSEDRSLKQWDVTTGLEIDSFVARSRTCIATVHYNPDGQMIVSGTWDGTMQLWDAVTGETIRTFSGHDSIVSSVCFSPCGTQIVSSSADRTLKLWDITGETDHRVLRGHSSAVTSVQFAPDGKRLLSGSADKSIKMWDVATGELQLTLQGHRSGVAAIGFSPDGSKIASGGSPVVFFNPVNSALKLWDTASGEEIRTLSADKSGFNSIGFSPDGKQLASTSEYSSVKLWNTENGEELCTLSGHSDLVTGLAFIVDGKQIVTSSHDKTLKLWDVESGTAIHTFKGHDHEIASMSISSDGSRLASGDRGNLSMNDPYASGGVLKLWDTTTGAEIRTMTMQNSAEHVQFCSNDTRLFCLSRNAFDVETLEFRNWFRLWDPVTGQELLSIEPGWPSAGELSSVTVSPDGMRILAGNERGEVLLWDSTPSQNMRFLNGDKTVSYTRFSADGTKIIAADFDPLRISLWDVKSGDRLYEIDVDSLETADEEPIICFSGDGTQVTVTAWSDETKRWNSTTGQPMEGAANSEFYNSDKTADGRWQVLPMSNSVAIVDLEYKNQPHEQARRTRFIERKVHWHRQRAQIAEAADQWYAATFHRAWVLAADPASETDRQSLKRAYQSLLATNEQHAERLPTTVKEMLNVAMQE